MTTVVPVPDVPDPGPSAGPQPDLGAAAPAPGATGATTGAEVTDRALVAGLTDRDAAALDGLYERYGRPAFSLARRVCADDGLAEEVVQEVFLVLWREPGRYDPARGTVAGWLLTLVHHKAVDAVRREATRRRHHPSIEAPEDVPGAAGPPADVPALGSVIAEQVRSALGRLPREQREALGLAYYGGYTQREVAGLTGVPIGTVKSRMFAGVARLRVLLGPVLGAPEVLGEGP